MSEHWERKDTSRITPEYSPGDKDKEMVNALNLIIEVCQEALTHPGDFDAISFGMRRSKDDWFRITQAGDIHQVGRLVEGAQLRIIRAAMRAGLV